MPVIVGNSGSNNLQGGAGSDLIYGFDPNGAEGQVSSITATRVASGLAGALFAIAPPGDTGRLFIVQQSGVIRILDLNSGQLLATPFLTVQVDSSLERGLLGLAFDPDYASNGFFYIYRTVPGMPAYNVIERYRVSADPNVADPASATRILSPGNLSATNHNGGWIGFGPDGYLYAAVGDDGNSANAQNINNLFGKILRIDVHGDAFPSDSNRNYAVPHDNMFVSMAGADEIFALGLRNPFRASFDRWTGDFFIADVGQSTWEEIDIGTGGANYGWPNYEGPSGSGTVAHGTLTAPIHAYNHSVGNSIIGGYVYRGSSDGLQGQLFFADLNGKIFTLRFNGTGWIATERTAQLQTNAGTIDMPSSFGQDARGNLYVTDYADGEVYRLTPAAVSNDQNDTLSGFNGDDMMFGGSGDDVLDGGEGADIMMGGAGNDTFVVDSVGDEAAESVGAGTDIVQSSVTYTLGPNIERLALGGSAAINGTGNALGNTITGNAGENILSGLGGEDTLAGGPGTDSAMFSGLLASYSISREGGEVVVSGPDGTDTLRAIERLVFGDTILDLVYPETDSNGDGKSDVLWQNDDGTAAVWLLDTYSLIDGNVVGSNPGPEWHVKGSGDFNGDGVSDVLWQHDDGRAQVWLLDGLSLIAGGVVGAPESGWHVIASGDFNGDDKSDILWQHEDGPIKMSLLDGLNLINASEFGPNPGAAWRVKSSGDFNGDGISDVLWQHDDGRAAVWLLDGTNVIDGNVVGNAPGADWQIKGSGDFNGDGKSDVLWQNDDGRAAVWLLDGLSLVDANAVGNNPGIAWQVSGSGDFNGDGKSDVLWQHVNGQPAIWLMDGLSLVGAELLGVNPGPSWHLV